MRERRTNEYRDRLRETRKQRMIERTVSGRPIAPPGPTGGGGMRALPLLIAALTLVVLGGLFVWRVLGSATVPSPPDAQAPPAPSAVSSRSATAVPSGTLTSGDFTVTQGETLSDVATRLQDQGIIRSAAIFRAEVRFKGIDPNIQPGTYHLTSSMSTEELVDAMRKAPEKPQASVLFKEGWRLEEDAQAIDSTKVLKASDYLAATGDASAYKAQYPFLADAPKGATLNGFLFPDTYKFEVPASPADVVNRQLTRFSQQVTPEMIAKAKASGHSLWDVLIIASIVEREAQVASERPMIAGAYWNRIKVGEGLFADPTVQYALGFDTTTKTWWRVLSTDDLKTPSPYNTYRVKGLPPGPICNPGLSSINGAINPEGDYLYFLAKGDGTGTHVFAKTLEEHNANVKKYQK